MRSYKDMEWNEDVEKSSNLFSESKRKNRVVHFQIHLIKIGGKAVKGQTTILRNCVSFMKIYSLKRFLIVMKLLLIV